jgi:hypothetical protein
MLAEYVVNETPSWLPLVAVSAGAVTVAGIGAVVVGALVRKRRLRFIGGAITIIALCATLWSGISLHSRRSSMLEKVPSLAAQVEKHYGVQLGNVGWGNKELLYGPSLQDAIFARMNTEIPVDYVRDGSTVRGSLKFSGYRVYLMNERGILEDSE